VTRILLANEPGVYRTGLRIFIPKRLPDAEVVETSDPVEGFLEVRRGESFDLVLMGPNTSGVSSLNALKTWKEIYTASRFAIVSAFDVVSRFLPVLLPVSTASFRNISPTTKLFALSMICYPDASTFPGRL